MGIFTDSVYTEIYAARIPLILTNPTYTSTIHYGAMYQVYKTTARTYSSVYDIMKFAEKNTDRELGTESVSAIAAQLGINDTSLLQNEDVKITLESTINYCNEFMREHQLLEQVKDAVLDALIEAEAASELLTISSSAYATDLQNLKTAIGKVVSAVTVASASMLDMLSPSAKAEFEECLAYLNIAAAKLGDIMQNGITSSELLLLISKSEEKTA